MFGFGRDVCLPEQENTGSEAIAAGMALKKSLRDKVDGMIPSICRKNSPGIFRRGAAFFVCIQKFRFCRANFPDIDHTIFRRIPIERAAPGE
jgi:hypothetical protein